MSLSPRASGPLLLALLSCAALGGCSLVPARAPLPHTEALPPAETGLLSDANHSVTGQLSPGESAFWLLDRADLSFEARLALIDQATTSLDIQYFIWEKDPSSRMFTHRVVMAADRGVRVRILLDDLTLNGQDAEYHALSHHPNIEVRTFNPFNMRSNIGRVFEFIFRFPRLNHRMHNKIVLADNRFAIIGGRNIGDRYFGLWDDFVQNDLDVLSVGPLVREVSASFDDYWNNSNAYPLELVVSRKSDSADLDEVIDFLEQNYLEVSDRINYFPLKPIEWDSYFTELQDSFAPGTAVLVQDSPAIEQVRPDALVDPFLEFLARAEESVLISSPYLIPDREFFELLEALERRGVEIVIVTNSLASNNHMIAHSGYKRWRKRLLRIGVDLYESRADSPVIDYYTTPPTSPAFLGLHTKGAVVDGRWSYIGSANIDPRSLVINTELAYFVDSESLAQRLTALIDRDRQADTAWRVTLNERGRLRWTSSAGTVKRQPAQGLRQRIAEFFIALLPLKQQA